MPLRRGIMASGIAGSAPGAPTFGLTPGVEGQDASIPITFVAPASNGRINYN
jgi:hypothetical protein